MWWHLKVGIWGWLGHEGCSSVQFSCSVKTSGSFRPYEPQHARPPCPSPNPGVYPDSCPLSRWCHPTISSSGVPFSFCPQSFSASRYFQISYFFASGWALVNGTSALIKETSEGFLTLLPNEDRWKVVSLQPRKWLPPESHHTGTLILDFQSP